MRKKISFVILSLLLWALLILSGVMTGWEFSNRQKDKDNFHILAKLVEPKDNTAVEPEETEIRRSTAEEPEAAQHQRNLAPLFRENSDCIGWLSILDTGVDYPVMHTPAEPQKYLRKNFYGEYSTSGVPFLDGRCSLTGTNLILYGHNMKNGTMFASVTGYANEDYAKEHPAIEFETASGCTVYQVFAVTVVDKYDDWYGFIGAVDEAAYQEKISNIRDRAMYTTGAVPEYGSQLLTLSTCYRSGSDQRFLVIAVETTANK